MAEYHSQYRTMFECMDKSPQSVPDSTANTDGALFYQTEVKCNRGFPCLPYDTQKEVVCSVHKVTCSIHYINNLGHNLSYIRKPVYYT